MAHIVEGFPSCLDGLSSGSVNTGSWVKNVAGALGATTAGVLDYDAGRNVLQMKQTCYAAEFEMWARQRECTTQGVRRAGAASINAKYEYQIVGSNPTTRATYLTNQRTGSEWSDATLLQFEKVLSNGSNRAERQDRVFAAGKEFPEFPSGMVIRSIILMPIVSSGKSRDLHGIACFVLPYVPFEQPAPCSLLQSITLALRSCDFGESPQPCLPPMLSLTSSYDETCEHIFKRNRGLGASSGVDALDTAEAIELFFEPFFASQEANRERQHSMSLCTVTLPRCSNKRPSVALTPCASPQDACPVDRADFETFFEEYVSRGRGPQWADHCGLYTPSVQDSDWINARRLHQLYNAHHVERNWPKTDRQTLFRACREWMSDRFYNDCDPVHLLTHKATVDCFRAKTSVKNYHNADAQSQKPLGGTRAVCLGYRLREN